MKGRQLHLFLFFQLSCNFGMIKKGKVILKWHVSPSIRLGQGIVGSWNRPQTQPGGRTQRGQVSSPLSRRPLGPVTIAPHLVSPLPFLATDPCWGSEPPQAAQLQTTIHGIHCWRWSEHWDPARNQSDHTGCDFQDGLKRKQGLQPLPLPPSECTYPKCTPNAGEAVSLHGGWGSGSFWGGKR